MDGIFKNFLSVFYPIKIKKSFLIHIICGKKDSEPQNLRILETFKKTSKSKYHFPNQISQFRNQNQDVPLIRLPVFYTNFQILGECRFFQLTD